MVTRLAFDRGFNAGRRRTLIRSNAEQTPWSSDFACPSSEESKARTVQSQMPQTRLSEHDDYATAANDYVVVEGLRAEPFPTQRPRDQQKWVLRHRDDDGD